MLKLKKEIPWETIEKLGYTKVHLFGINNKIAYRKGTLYIAAWPNGKRKIYYSYVEDELDDLYDLFALGYVDKVKGDIQ